MGKKFWLKIAFMILFIGISVEFMGIVSGYFRVQEVAVYRQGSQGDMVMRIQEELSNQGIYKGEVDGVFGPVTEEAVREFQRQKGLVADGIVGDMTLEALGIAVGDYDDDLYLLASVIYGEGRGEPYEGQVAIGAVVLNRVESEVFPNTVQEVVFQNGAFSAVEEGQIYLGVNETAIKAAKDALNGVDPTGGALYYWNPATATSQWIWSIPIETSIGRHVFGGSE